MTAASAAQLEIWLADRCEPESGRYNIPVCLEFRGGLDDRALRAALADVLERHPAPAGRFETVEGTLRHTADPDAAVPLHLAAHPGGYDREVALADAARSAERPLDPGTAPLLRAEVLRFDDGALVTVTVHHLVADGRSVEVLTEDLITAYRARHTGRDPRFVPVPVPEPQPVAAAPDPYWTTLLDGDPARLAPLPDGLRAEDGARGPAGWTERELDGGRLAEVRALAAREGASPAMILLAVWSLLLHAWSGEDDGVLGMPFAGRHEPGTDNAVGLFTRVLPVRTVHRASRPFADHAAALGDQVFASMEAHAESGDLPPGSAPVPSAVFLHQPQPASAWQVPGAEVRLLHPESAVAKYDLAFAAVEGPDGLVLRIDYDQDLYTSATAELMAEQIDRMLAAASRPGITCHELLASLASAPDTAVSVATGAPVTAATVPELVLEQARLAPGSPAVVHNGTRLSYGELVRDAARMAHWLRIEGVRTDDVVALLLRPGPDTVTAMLAVGLAGAAYLPLDPAYPDAQLELVVSDARPRLLIAEPGEEHRVTGLPVHTPEAVRKAARPLPVSAPTTSAGPDTAFNVLYTSGSTGRPKGVVLPHGGVLRMMHRPEFVPLGPDDTVSHLSPLNFDGATYEIWGALTHGAKLVVLDKELVLSPRELRAAIREHGVTTLLVTTPLLNRLIEDTPDLLQSLRRVYFGGENISVPHIRKALRWARPGTLLHSYGPTENSFTSSWYPIEEVPRGARTVPIGRAVPGTRLHVVLEGTLEPAPVYVPGELVLGGAGVARGYLGDPRRTAERFVPDPFGDEPGARLYRTGDRVRWAPDGQLEFIGRADNQVKIRSQRVELGEVEAALRAHPQVRGAFVTTRINGAGEKEIVGYAVLDRPSVLEAVRAHLRAVLPLFAVPSHLLALGELPLTPNGKIDRKRLPAPPDATVPAPVAATVAPGPAAPGEGAGDGVTGAVLKAWRKVLPGRVFDRETNFFDAGGHSLLLVKLQDALLEATGTAPSVSELMRYTSVRSQARLIGGAAADEETTAPVRASRATVRDEDDAIAVIGMGARFAGAPDLAAYWDNLVAGRDCFTEGPGPLVTERGDGTRRVARWGMVADGTGYDAGLLGLTADDVESGDPQHGVLHEVLWAAVEDASLRLSDIAHRTSLYAGCPRLAQTDGEARVDDVVSVDPTFVASRFAYLHDLWGEALLLDTACSTGLYAVHLACRALLRHESDYALAGSVSLDGESDGSYVYRPGLLYADDGMCRPFDRRASGTVGGFGAGALLLRRLSDAERDGDPVHAVIRGSAVNNDGRERVGYSAPGIEGQARVIRRAVAAAGVTGADIGYVEAHGTGTRLGDAIEATALGAALGTTGPQVAVGSVKASIGHCNTAAGIAGLIKTVLAVHHGVLPATPNVSEPIDELAGLGGRFALLTEGRAWDTPDGRPRTAGVSSFGVGGTNAHVVVQEHVRERV
ncbi:non-ribosomal peptide synthetase [Streptomyces sp. JV190]|uniref:non-ribosomal peptide synthetase n=1 Tax=Streptomyces sp. JV190 TaxID=3002533 RepID=UPI002E789A1E|nr:amino acid adenylation domain-containing protein [Streptomyces sp. JV190]MEE1838634.1 amino acid adenylation domain-containing protein [Streptomyces sp. JV190]